MLHHLTKLLAPVFFLEAILGRVRRHLALRRLRTAFPDAGPANAFHTGTARLSLWRGIDLLYWVRAKLLAGGGSATAPKFSVEDLQSLLCVDRKHFWAWLGRHGVYPADAEDRSTPPGDEDDPDRPVERIRTALQHFEHRYWALRPRTLNGVQIAAAHALRAYRRRSLRVLACDLHLRA